VRLVFVDGNHEKKSVEEDVDTGLPHMEPGGFLLLHDSTWVSAFPGPMEVGLRAPKAGG